MSVTPITPQERQVQAHRLEEFAKLSTQMTATYQERAERDVRLDCQYIFTQQMEIIAKITRGKWDEPYKASFQESLRLLFDCLQFYCEKEGLKKEAIEEKDEPEETPAQGFASLLEAKDQIKVLPLRDALLRARATSDHYTCISALYEITVTHKSLGDHKELMESIVKGLKIQPDGDYLRRVIIERMTFAYYRSPYEAFMFLAQNDALCSPLYCGRIIRLLKKQNEHFLNLYPLFSQKAYRFQS